MGKLLGRPNLRKLFNWLGFGRKMGKVRVKRQTKRNIYVHNDLLNGAYYFKERVVSRVAQNEHEGLTFEILAELIFLAFTVEAQINFFGAKLISDWKERQPFWTKVKSVLAHLEIDADFKARPYLTLSNLKDLRDTLAHGKPLYLEHEDEVVVEADQLHRKRS